MGSPPPPGLNQDKSRAGGTFGGLIVGYRFSSGFAAEFQAETSNHSIAACQAVNGQSGCTTTLGNYSIQSSRIGPAVRFMTNGRKGRFVGTVGLGAAVHSVSYDKAIADAVGKKDVSAVGSYLMLEGGYELNLGHFLLDAGLLLVGETLDEGKTTVKNAGSAGLALRVGYGQW